MNLGGTMWIVFAFGSAVFAGLTSILAKCGVRETDSTVATAIRTIVVLAFSWLMVFLTGSQTQIASIDAKTLLFLILSGLATGASWLCYFKALQAGDINKVVPVDKSSTVLTILLAFLFLRESITVYSGAGVFLIGAGTFLMIEKKDVQRSAEQGSGWFLYAAGSAVFASLTSILGKIGISGVESNLGTAVRTGVVLIMSWLMVFVTGKQKELKQIDGKEIGFLFLSGLATGGSWLCYYKALQDGFASVVVPVDKLSILVTITFSYFVFHERLSKRSAAGLAAVVAGTVVMLLPNLPG
ncbi:MAG: EamA family transporter [Anaerovoracaceae bacterium]